MVAYIISSDNVKVNEDIDGIGRGEDFPRNLPRNRLFLGKFYNAVSR